MLSTRYLSFLLLTTATLFISPGYANFLTDQPNPSNPDDETIQESFEELNDLNIAVTTIETANKQHKQFSNSVYSSSFNHRDEDMQRLKSNLEPENSLKYDVEILETSDIKRENIEIEERFKGNAMEFNTDNFIAENIEVHGGDSMEQSHMILTIILVMVALISIALYAALVIWRSHLELRYGMRELLVTDDDDYCQQQQQRINNTATGHFSVVQL